MQICDELLKETSTDSSALQLMNLILKELRREQDITAVYVSAAAAQPHDIDLQKQVFAAYIRYHTQRDILSLYSLYIQMFCYSSKQMYISSVYDLTSITIAFEASRPFKSS